jgi:predicted RND superfamily exporter protein
VVNTKEENGLYEPEILHGMETLARDIETIRDGELFVGRVFSVNDILKETNQALHENDPAYYTIPDERALIAQELFLFENSGSDDLETVVDSLFSKARFTIKTSWVEAVQYGEFIKKVEKMFHDVFSEDVDITITGLVSVMARAIPASINSAVKSYIIAAVVIALMMISVVGGLRIGLLSMLPNFLPIVIVLGFMGFAGIPVDMVSILIGSIALGLVVDDTVHFIYNFRKYYHETGDVRKAVEQTFLGTGRALLTTSVVLSTGFIVFVTATMLNIQRFGILVTMTIVVALLADFVLSPALLVLFAKRNKAKQPVRIPEEQTVRSNLT